MRVLLLIADLYVDVGGGQTVYRKIIEASPEINFFYFREKELPDSSRPRNAQAIPLLTPQAAEIIPLPPQPMRHNAVQAGALRQANRFARSVAGMSFDIAEMPDYHTFGAFIRSTFLHHNVSCDCIVLAMHGNISNSIALNWTSQTTRLEQLKELERVQFGSADGVYGISRRYIQEWQKLLPRSVHYIDPLNFVNLPKDLRPWKPAQLSRPILYCIGRRERRKGNDIFVDMLRWLAPSSFAEAAHIGGADSTSEKILVEAARLRAAQVSTQMDLSQSTLRNLYATPSFVVLPVRYDTLNLVALEAVFAGCPIALSTKAGVSDYLDAEHPKIPYVKLNLDDYHGSIPALQRAIDGYDKYRAKLHSALALILPQLDLRLDMYGIYSKILQQSRGLETLAHIPKAASKTKIIDFVKSSRVRTVNDVVYKELRSVGFSGVDRLISFSANESLPVALATALCKLIARVEQFGTRFIRTILGLRKRLEQRVKHSYWWRYLGLTIDSLRTPKRLRGISRLEETSRAANFSKVRYIHSQLVSPFLRVNFWADMARLYRLRKNDQLAAVY
jgi:glycosyltransferase involved in cell wall biosynthesis